MQYTYDYIDQYASLLFLTCSTLSHLFAIIVRSVVSTSHVMVVPLKFMTLSDTCFQYLSVTCNPHVYISSSESKQPPYCVY
jgi:hypothetical protein